jgi:hypothetical protein
MSEQSNTPQVNITHTMRKEAVTNMTTIVMKVKDARGQMWTA